MRCPFLLYAVPLQHLQDDGLLSMNGDLLTDLEAENPGRAERHSCGVC